MTDPEGSPAPPLDDARDARALTPGENADLCQDCVRCCTYITVEIDAPRAAWEYDQWLWALHHQQVNLYLERPERWFLHFETRCRQLLPSGRCAIYGRHPVLCRDYDPRSCERRLPLADIVAWFHTAEQLEGWIRERRPRHWERLKAFRRGPEAPARGAGVGADFVPIQALAAASVSSNRGPAIRGEPGASASRLARAPGPPRR